MVGSLHAEEFEIHVLVHFLADDELAYFHRDVLEPGVVDLDFLHEVSGGVNHARSIVRQAGFAGDGFGHPGLYLGYAVRQPDEQFLVGIVVQERITDKIVRSAMRARPNEKFALEQLFLDFGVLPYVYYVVCGDFRFRAAMPAAGLNRSFCHIGANIILSAVYVNKS